MNADIMAELTEAFLNHYPEDSPLKAEALVRLNQCLFIYDKENETLYDTTTGTDYFQEHEEDEDDEDDEDEGEEGETCIRFQDIYKSKYIIYYDNGGVAGGAHVAFKHIVSIDDNDNEEIIDCDTDRFVCIW